MSAKISSFPGASGRGADLLVEKLQDPQVVHSLVSLLEKSQMLNDFLERGEAMLNSVSKGVGQLGRAGVAGLSKTFESVDLDELKAAGQNLQAMIPAVRDFMRELGSLKEAGFFEPEVVKIISQTGRALSAAARDPEARSDHGYGLLSLPGLLKEPEVARTFNFIISFARHFGGDLDKDGAVSARK
ncbi:MAG: hypothetical protein JO025_05850 [Verrucomicrobia bacterium]|nr:hypothetical protein [Verrucomicrobiota bacterium]